MSPSLHRRSAILLLPLGLLLTPLIASAAPTGPAMPAGCQPSWSVLRHGPSGSAAARDNGHIACSVLTGKAVSEPSLTVTRKGTIVGTPFGDENTELRSTDGARTVTVTRPALQQRTALWNTVDAYLTSDPRTGRLYMSRVTGPTRTTPILVDNSPLPGGVSTAAAAAYGLELYTSGDEGRTWATADYTTTPIGDWTKIFTAPQPRTSAVRSRSGSIVYACGNSPFEAVGPGRLCLKSLDDGATFTPAGYVFPSPQVPGVCMPLAANNGTAAPDGSIYQPVSCTNGSYVAASTDEGATYTYHLVPGVPGSGLAISGFSWQIAADSTGVVYGTWADGTGLHLTVSRDHAHSWSTPLLMTAPGQTSVTLPQLAAGGHGQMGVVYYASEKAGAPQTPWITQAANAETAHPTFLSGPIDDPRHPRFVDGGLSGPSPRADYLGASFDTHGQLWGYVVRQTSAPDANNKIGTVGILGHLAAIPQPSGSGRSTAAPPRARGPRSASPGLAATGLAQLPAVTGGLLLVVGVTLRRFRRYPSQPSLRRPQQLLSRLPKGLRCVTHPGSASS